MTVGSGTHQRLRVTPRLAFLKLMDDGHVGIMWMPLIFASADMLPDDLRETLIAALRFHADRLKDRTLD